MHDYLINDGPIVREIIEQETGMRARKSNFPEIKADFQAQKKFCSNMGVKLKSWLVAFQNQMLAPLNQISDFRKNLLRIQPMY